MPAPLYGAADFVSALQGLMPRGRAWSKDPASVQGQSLGGLAPVFARQTARAAQLLVDAFPLTTYELLPQWEATLGLPDPCAGPSPTIQARRAQVVARFVNTGGQSVPFMLGFLANLGFPTATITEYAPFRAGVSTCGQPLGTSDWSHTWSVALPTNTIGYFRAGQSGAGEPLETWGNLVPQCELQAVKPAHTILNFTYF